MSSPPIEPMSEHIPDQFPLGKAQRLGRRAYESPALPLSYSAVGSKLTEHDPSQQPRDMQLITVEQHMPCRGQAARIDRGRDQSVWRGWPTVARVRWTMRRSSSMQYQIRPAPVTSYCHWSSIRPPTERVAKSALSGCWRWLRARGSVRRAVQAVNAGPGA